MGLAVNTLTRPQLWAVAVCFMLLMLSNLVITCFLRINQSLLFLFKVFSSGSGEFWASHALGTVDTSVCQVTSQCPGIHVGPRFPCVSGALGSLRGEKTPSNTGATFVERSVPWKVFFGRMSNNEVGRRSENRSDYFGNREGVSCCRGWVYSVTMILQELNRRIPWTNPANSHNYVAVDRGNNNFFHFLGH